MNEFTLHDLHCFDTVVRAGGFQAAAAALHRSHPAVFSAVARLERQLGIALLDRSGYRVRLTADGRAFHRKAQTLLTEFNGLRTYASQLAMGEESELHVVIGDLCPRDPTLALLALFFASCPGTRMHLHVEAVGGPQERLLDGDADLIVHRIDKADPRLEWADLCKVELIPVIAPALLPAGLPRMVKPEHLRELTQCVMRDTARHTAPRDYFVLEGAPQCTVADQSMTREIILHGLGWGHLPQYMIEDDLRADRLRSLAGRHLPGACEEIVVARRGDKPHGPVAQRLWRYFGEHGANAFRSPKPSPVKRRRRSP
ncbi:LysR family transcriptional regulator [Trinickia sp.]|uniref:LysR family transcriptional regulator n=1 Tax=Trinickia sp. TaxID=2571163 RepID=UPI003F81A1A0